MPARADDTSPAEAAVEGEVDEREFLKRGLLLGEGFQFYVGTAASTDARDQIIADLRATEGLSVASVRGEDAAGSIDRAITKAFNEARSGPGRPVVVVTDIEADAAAGGALLRQLNERRSELIANAPGGLVVLGGEHAVQTLRRVAPDTWSVRAADVELDKAAPPQAGGVAAEVPTLAPIRSPDPGERNTLEAELVRLPPGDRRGRVAMRLAEVLHFEAPGEPRRAELMAQAAAEIADPWLSTVARINEGRARRELGDPAAAREALERALQSSAMRDGSLRAYAGLSLTRALLDLGDLQGAWDRITEVLSIDADRDLICEAHLLSADVAERSRDLHAAMAHLQVAESLAMGIGDRRWVAPIRRRMLEVAARSGQRDLAASIVRRTMDDEGEEALRADLPVVFSLARADHRQAAEIAWQALWTVSQGRGLTSALLDRAARSLYHLLADSGERNKFEWLLALLHEAEASGESGAWRQWLALADARSSLGTGGVQRAYDRLKPLFQSGSPRTEISSSPAAMATWIGTCRLAGQDREAAEYLKGALAGSQREELLEYLADLASKSRTLDQIPPAEAAVILLAFPLLVLPALLADRRQVHLRPAGGEPPGGIDR